jgi:hypothetical protein
LNFLGTIFKGKLDTVLIKRLDYFSFRKIADFY